MVRVTDGPSPVFCTVPYSLSGNDFVIEVTFTDRSTAIYEGIMPQSVPEPLSVVLLAVGAGAVFVAHRFRVRRSR